MLTNHTGYLLIHECNTNHKAERAATQFYNIIKATDLVVKEPAALVGVGNAGFIPKKQIRMF